MRRLLLACLLGASCAHRHPAADVLGAYLEAEQRGRYEAAHALLTTTDRAARPLDAYTREHLAAGPIWLAVAARTRFEVEVTSSTADLVHLSVEATHPDMRAVEAAVPGLPPEHVARAEDPAAEMRAHVEQVLDHRPVPTTTESLRYAVQREGEDWRVWLALDRQDAAIRHMARAQRAFSDGDRDLGLAELKAVLEVAPDPAGVVATLQEEARRALAQLDGEAPTP